MLPLKRSIFLIFPIFISPNQRVSAQNAAVGGPHLLRVKGDPRKLSHQTAPFGAASKGIAPLECPLAQSARNFSKNIDEYYSACYNPAAFVPKGAIQFLFL